MPARSSTFGIYLSALLGISIVGFLIFELPTSGVGRKHTYTVMASFEDIGGVQSGSPVNMAGVNVGRVEKVRFDARLRRAVATLRINSEFASIPRDSEASVAPQGLVGGASIAITPGGSDISLQDGGRIDNTRSALVLEKLVNQVFSRMTVRSK